MREGYMGASAPAAGAAPKAAAPAAAAAAPAPKKAAAKAAAGEDGPTATVGFSGVPSAFRLVTTISLYALACASAFSICRLASSVHACASLCRISYRMWSSCMAW
jgi:hypothetical protein